MTTSPISLVSPGDAAWDDSRSPWNRAIDQRPAAVALPTSADEVAAAVRTARERGLRVTAQNTGHGAGITEADGALLIRTAALDDVAIDASAKTASVGAGAVWGAVAAAAAEHGLAGAAGSSPTVGVVGYILGGGHGWLASRTGLAANDLIAVELVTATGEQVRIDDASDPEAMWALRGGGCAFGVITSVEIGLHEVGTVAGGGLFWPVERAGEVLEAWRAWSADLPEGVTTIGRVLRFPPFEMVPEPFRGRAFVIVELVDLSGPDRLEELVAPLRALGPEVDALRPMPASDVSQVHMDPPEPAPARGQGVLLTTLPADAVAAAVAAALEGPGQALIGIEIRRLGGAVAQGRAPGVGCSTDAEAAAFGVGMAATPEMTEGVLAGLAATRAALGPWTSEENILNLAEADPSDAIFSAEDLARLHAVADRLDPDGVFVRRP